MTYTSIIKLISFKEELYLCKKKMYSKNTYT